MATASVARPAQAAHRQRREAPRPSVTKRDTTTTENGNEQGSKKRRLNEPHVRTSSYILRKHRGKPPSLKIHLHDTFFRFDGQEGSLPYDSPMKFVIRHLREQTVPHELLEELLSNNVPFYDGCLIVEVHNHRTADGKDRNRHDSGAGADKFSMHNYTQHITPSPFVPYPAKAHIDETAEKSDAGSGDAAASQRPERGRDKDGPKINHIVLHPTALVQHHELLILANTPASEARGKKKGGDGATSSSAQPPTPQMSVPPTPISATRGPLPGSQKMALEEDDFYSFQADLRVATEPPLYLEPASTAEESDRIIEMLSNPLHQQKPPSPKTRKRTTAEMAADDAQAAEAERRMLIMDERIKPSVRAGAGTAANENQGTAASLGFSRFKTLEMVRQKHEEQDRLKKEEEARVELEKRQANEQNAQHAQAKLMQQKMARMQPQHNQQGTVLLPQQRNEMIRQHQMAAMQQRQAQMAELGQPQPNGMQNGMQTVQQGNFQHPAAISQGSPIARQRTPMVNSSPMLPNGGFPMAPTSSQGAGSPSRPTTDAMQNRNVPMARQASQPQHGSQQNTPQIPQGTPSMAQAVPNRQMSQTPRMQPGSPAMAMQGTPTSAALNPPTPQMGQPNTLTPAQMAMLAAQRSLQNQSNQGGIHAGSPPQGMTPEQIQQIQRAQAQSRHNAMMQQAQRNQNPQMTQQMQAHRAHVMRQAAIAAQMQQLAQMQQSGQAGSPGALRQPTPQMGHAHPPQTPGQQQHPSNMGQAGGDITPQQHAAAQAKAQQIAMQRQMMNQIHQIAGQYGGYHNIPPNVVNNMAPPQRAILQASLNNQRNRQAQAQAMRAQQQQQQQQQQMAGGGEQVPAQPNPQYMQALRNNQAAMMAHMQQNQQQGQGGGGGGNGAMNMNMDGMQGQGQQGQQAGTPGLDPYFTSMQNALNQPGRQQGNNGMQ